MHGGKFHLFLYITINSTNLRMFILSEDFKKIEELLGLDLDDTAIRNLQEARRDKETGNINAYVDLNSI